MDNKVERVGVASVAHKDGSVDYLLSDYEEDVKRILYADTRLVPSGCYGTSGAMSAIGSVECRVVYLSSSERLGGVSFSADYEIPISVSEESGEGECSVELLSSAVRPLSGRRLQGKYTLAARYVTRSEEDLSVTGDGIEEEGCVTLNRKVRVPFVRTVRSEEREYAEPLCKSEREGRYLFSDARCRVDRIVSASGGFVVSGTIEVCTLVEREGLGVSTEEVRIPFEEFVVCEDGHDGAEVSGTCQLKSLVITEHKEEESVVAVASVICRLELCVLYTEACTIVRDLYSTEREMALSYREVSYPTDASLYRQEFRTEHKVTKASMETPEMSEILLCRAEMRPTYAASSGALTLEGEAIVTILGGHTREDGSRVFCRHVERIPVHLSAPVSGLSADAKLTPLTGATRCEAIFDGDSLVLSLEHSCSLLGMREEHTRAVVHAECGEDLPRERADDELWVLYPDEDLWQTVKRHHLPLDKVCADNAITLGDREADAPELLDGVCCLWIE